MPIWGSTPRLADDATSSGPHALRFIPWAGIIQSTSAALKRNDKDVALLLRRAALLIALGEPALARKDYERVRGLVERAASAPLHAA